MAGEEIWLKKRKGGNDHQKGVKQKDGSFKCKHCGDIFMDKNKLTGHMYNWCLKNPKSRRFID